MLLNKIFIKTKFVDTGVVTQPRQSFASYSHSCCSRNDKFYNIIIKCTFLNIINLCHQIKYEKYWTSQGNFTIG